MLRQSHVKLEESYKILLIIKSYAEVILKY